MEMRRVVITGLGCRTSLGHEVEEVWQKLLAGTSGISTITKFNTEEFGVKFGGEIKDFQPKHIAARELKKLDPFTAYALDAAVDAVNDSGLDFDKEDRFRCGSLIGSGIGGLLEMEEGTTKLVKRGPGRLSPFMVPKMMCNAAPGNVSIHFGLCGPNTSVATACASAGHAIGDAYNHVRLGSADVMVTGASEAALTPLGLGCFEALRALSKRNDDPTAASRPFDDDRDGFVLAEGCGILILEEYEHAKARGAKIYAELCGYGQSGDGSHITAPLEDGAGASKAMDFALADAELSPEQVSYINAHGTSTPLGDKAETNAVKKSFGDHAKQVAISSTKSMTGHLLGATGGVEAMICALAIRDGKVPPTINLEKPSEGCDLDYVPGEAREMDVNVAMSNSFGFGGHNVSIVLSKV